MLKSLSYPLYLSFYYLSIRQAIKLSIILHSPYSWPLKGKIIIDAPRIYFRMIRLGLFDGGLSNGHGFVWMNEARTVIFHGEFIIGPGSVAKIAHPKAILESGDNVCNASSLRIDCHYQINIGERTRFGWNVITMDSNLHQLENEDGTWKGKGYDTVDTGGNAWISSQCVVPPGTKSPSYSACALGSILSKDYSNNERGLYVGRPAKLIKAGIWRDMSDDIVHYDENS